MSNLIPRIEFLAQSLFRQQSFCPHCQSKEVIVIAKKYASIKIKQCKICRIYFTSPIYRPLLENHLYDHLYKAEGATTSLPSSDVLKDLKYNCFQSSDKYFGDRIRAIKSCDMGAKTLLELGSSWGYFLYQAQQQKLEATGIELSAPRRSFGIRNLGVRIVENIGELSGEVFDIVYTAHTLEHFNNLTTIFADIAGVLKEGGKLLIEVPNFDFTVLGRKVISMIGAVHPLGFSSEFFQQNLPKYGFDIIGFYESWEGFPHQIFSNCAKDVIILMAKKKCSTRRNSAYESHRLS